MNYLSLFSGIGAFEAAMKRIGMPYDVVGFSEIDKYAVRSYCAVHGIDEALNLGDITKIDVNHLPNDIDLITYGFPCQDISLAGKQKGLFNADGTQTRSGLFFEALRIIEATKPKVAIAENVKNLTGKKFKPQFELVLKSLEEAGYHNYWKVLNAKDYCIPQNRERVFIVSIRKDVDNYAFRFPSPFPLMYKLKDFLEDEVDEKFYLSEKCIKGFIRHRERHEAKGTGFKWEVRDTNGVASCLRANSSLAPTDNTISVSSDIKQVAQMYPDSGNPQAGRIYDSDGISPAMDTCSGGNRMPKVIIKEATKKGYAEAYEGDSVNLGQPNSKTRRGRVGKQVSQTLTTSPNMGVVLRDRDMNNEPFIVASRGRNPDNPSDRTAGIHTEQRLEPNTHGVANTLTTVQKDNLVAEPYVSIIDDMYKGRDQRTYDQYSPSIRSERQGLKVATSEQRLRIRKLTPKECWRLMGFDDSDFEKAEKVNSNTQLYKQAGNSIVVDVLCYIFGNLLESGILGE